MPWLIGFEPAIDLPKIAPGRIGGGCERIWLAHASGHWNAALRTLWPAILGIDGHAGEVLGAHHTGLVRDLQVTRLHRR
jgi:hypothetical protein